jgi:SSS family solute:Na+ symporter
VSLWISAAIVLAYIFLGGLTSAIYNEVMQFFLIIFGFAPLVFLGLKNVGGWPGLKEKLITVATHGQQTLGHAQNYEPNAWTSAWGALGSSGNNPMGVEWFGMAMGLGFVLSFGYWCTDFLVVQRAMVAKDEASARIVPLIKKKKKMLFPLLVIVPGMIAVALTADTLTANNLTAQGLTQDALAASGGFHIPVKEVVNGAAVWDYDMVIPSMLARYFPTGLLGLGLTALMASFMSGMAGNVTAFNTVWTYDIYQSYIAKGKSDQHYLWMGRAATVFGILVSLAAAYMANSFNNIMDMLQLVFAFVNAPLFATFLLGMFWRRTTGHGAFIGLIAGTLAATIHHGLTLPINAAAGVKGGWLIAGALHSYSSEMAQNFWTAIWSWSTCFVVTMLISVLTKRTKSDEDLKGLVFSLTPRSSDGHLAWYKRPVVLGAVILACALVLNIIFA